MIPLKRFYHWQDKAVHTIELLVIAFDTPRKAGEAARRLQELRRDGALDILNAATLVKDEAGKISLKEHEDVSAPPWRTLWGHYRRPDRIDRRTDWGGRRRCSRRGRRWGCRSLA